MVKYKGKEITQEEFDAVMQDAENASKLVKANEKKLEELQATADKAGKVDELEKLLNDRQTEIFSMKLKSRLSTVEKYVASKGNDKTLIQKLGEYSDEDFALFAEGKTNAEFTSKDEIESAKKDLEEKTKELTDNKDKLIADAIKNLEDKTKKASDQKIVPPSETNNNDTKDEETAKKYTSLDAVKELYKLDNNAAFEITETQTKKASSYINNYLENQDEEV
jgi:hypothetical protein